MMWVALIVAFIAGYSVVSYVARKVKEGRDRHPEPPKTTDDPPNFD